MRTDSFFFVNFEFLRACIVSLSLSRKHLWGNQTTHTMRNGSDEPTKKNEVGLFHPLSNKSLTCSSWQFLHLVITILLLISLTRVLRLDGSIPTATIKDGRFHMLSSSSSSSSSQDFLVATTTTVTTPHKLQSSITPLCQAMEGTSAIRFWMKHAKKIHRASRLPDDNDYQRHDVTAKVLAIIAPRLPNSVKTLVRDWKVVARLLQKGYQRYHYLSTIATNMTLLDQHHQHQQSAGTNGSSNVLPSPPPPPPPIRIAVMGGSVTLGVQCKTGIPGHGDKDYRYCAWPNRLQHLINQWFGGIEVVQVFNEAVGGTNSNIGTTMLRYQLISSVVQADIIIHAYSTNDVSQGNHTFSMLQNFVRQALEPTTHHSCTRRHLYENGYENQNGMDELPPRFKSFPPLLLHIHDVVTTLYERVIGEPSLSQVVETLANYYGFVSMSYTDMVRDWVYGDPKESWFSPNQFPKGSTYVYDIHPGQVAHMTMSWMVAFNLLNLATTYCDMRDWWPTMEGTTSNGPDEQTPSSTNLVSTATSHRTSRNRDGTVMMEYDQTILSESIPLRHNGTNERVEGVPPRPPPRGLPPPLKKDMVLMDLHTQWRQRAQQIHQIEQQNNHIGSGDVDHVREFCHHMNITFMSFSPLCGPCHIDDRKDSLIDGDLVTDLALHYNHTNSNRPVTGSQVSLRFIVQQGIPVIPKSNTMEHIRSNMDLFDFELSHEDMHRLLVATKPPAEDGDCDVP